MLPGKLTDRAVEKAGPGAVLWDDVVPGLHLRVTPTGKKGFFLYYRSRAGEQRRPKVGPSVLGVEGARTAAQGMLQLIAEGKDPVATAKASQGAPTVAELAELWWDERGSKQKGYREPRRHLDTYILSTLGGRKAVDINYQDCKALHRQVAAHAPIQANRVLATLSSMLTFAEKEEVRPLHSNPCLRVDRIREKARRRHMTGVEAPRIAAALRAHETKDAAGVAFIYLLIYSGARRSEIAGAKWEHLHGSVLRLPDGKNGDPRTIHLAPQAMEIIEGLPRVSDYIIRVRDPFRVWDIVRREAGCPDLRLHDLRRSFASAGLSAGRTLQQLGELLGQKSTQTTKGYAYLMEEAATAAVATVADRLTDMMGSKK